MHATYGCVCVCAWLKAMTLCVCVHLPCIELSRRGGGWRRSRRFYGIQSICDKGSGEGYEHSAHNDSCSLTLMVFKWVAWVESEKKLLPTFERSAKCKLLPTFERSAQRKLLPTFEGERGRVKRGTFKTIVARFQFAIAFCQRKQ